ncbi:hypothetical protein DZ860_02440 [Vibrio sinensis]|uniref:Cadmium carbonic anhydrase n=1 Tax=Vibrio sinensis TaxID=2302434 RepID=A0A3A6QYE1_9VIBR|nr:delta-class carbonic anhydrase [Vibrio sinensis]RJX75556.1 hypothetical protein DZ860_02440 [Vibrio sinensis]
MKAKTLLMSVALLCFTSASSAENSNQNAQVEDNVIAAQRMALAENTAGKGFGPQSPRDIDNLSGTNQRIFGLAPDYTEMNLCNIHFHKNAEHKGGEFNIYAGNGDGEGQNSGYVYSGTLTKTELELFAGNDGSLQAGDTIEVHYVHSTAKVKPGPTLGACLADSIGNPQLRVETQVYVLVNDSTALNFAQLTRYAQVDGEYQATNIPNNTGTPIQYAGSTTGPSYNEQGSPLQVTWSVRPKVAKVDITSVDKWLTNNDFNEHHAHGVRNLVINPELLSSGH